MIRALLLSFPLSLLCLLAAAGQTHDGASRRLLGADASPGVDAPDLIYAGAAQFHAGRPPRISAARARPLVQNGRFQAGYFIVHFREAIEARDRAQLDTWSPRPRRADGSLLARWYLPNRALVAWIADAQAYTSIAALGRVDWVAPYQPAYKLHPSLASAADGATLRVQADVMPGYPIDLLAAEVRRQGARVVEGIEGRAEELYDTLGLLLEIGPGALLRLARLEGVQMIRRPERRDPDAALPVNREFLRTFIRSNYRGRTPIPDPSRALLRALAVHTPGQHDARVAWAARYAPWIAYDVPTAKGFTGADAVPRVHTIRVQNGREALRVTLAWSDEPASRAWGKPLINDLDLIVLAPDGTLYRGGQLQHAAERSTPGGASDRWHDAERFALERPQVGEWTVVVRPGQGNFARAQGYALLATGEVAELGLGQTEPVLETLVTQPTGGWVETARRRLSIDEIDRLSASDNRRVTLVAGESSSLRFAMPSSGVPVVAVRLRLEHHEWEGGVAGLTWTSDANSEQAIRVPVRSGVADETRERWSLTALPTLGELTLTLMNTSSVDAELDCVLLDVDYLAWGGSLLATSNDRLDRHSSVLTGTSTAAPSIRSTPASAGFAGQPYRYDADGLAAADGAGPIFWSVVRGPVGFAIDARTGRVTWTPTLPALFTTTIRAANAFGADEQTWTAAVSALGALPPRITSTPSTSAELGVRYAYDKNARAEATGRGARWSLVKGPADMVIDPITGLVRWTPVAKGDVAVTLRVANRSGADTQSFVVEVNCVLEEVVFPLNPRPITYCPPERLALGPPQAQQALNVFLPVGTAPADGWPLVLANAAGGGGAFPALDSITQTGAGAILHDLLAAGVAVVHYGNTAVRNGAGLFYPPGHTSGRYESFQPLDDNPEKETEWAVQWVKTQASYPLDPERICLRGASQGAIISIWAGMGPERARTSGSAQVRASTRVKGIVALQPPTSTLAYVQTPELAVPMIAHFEIEDQPGVPATALSQVSEELQKDASVLRFAFETSAAQVNNASQPICLVYAEPIAANPLNFALDSEGFPTLRDELGIPNVHDSWFGYVFYKRLIDLSASSAAFHASNSIFAISDRVALPSPFNVHTYTFAGTLIDDEVDDLVHDWTLRTLNVPLTEPAASPR